MLAGTVLNVLKVYAAPNTTDKDRTLYIEVYSGSEYDVITVKQGKQQEGSSKFLTDLSVRELLNITFF